MSFQKVFSTDPNMFSSKALDPSNEPIQNPDSQHLVSSETDIQNIQNLIALASNVYFPSSASEDILSSPEVQQEQSFAKVLDSIAKLSVSAPQHEAVAVTFRLEGPFIYLHMAGNAPIPRNTVSHIYRLWTLLGHLSDDYEEYHKHSNQTTLRLPITSALPPAAQEKVKLFCREALKFSAEKIDRRISKGLPSFLAINSFELPSSSKLVMLQNLLRNLWRVFKARGILSNERWHEVWGWLRLVDVMTSEMFEEEPDIWKSMEQSFSAKRYLEKLVGVTRDVLILQNAANSLELRHQFKAYLTIKTVDPIGPVAALLPSTRKGWEEVAFNALGETNRGKLQSGEIEYEASSRKVGADAQRLSDRPPPPQHFVHCECTLLSHMLFYGEKPFINYIGVSKPCCRGCFHLIQSVNFANGTRFATKSCNHKWCYPWKFPPLPETTKNIVAKLMYRDLADLFCYTYPGFLRPTTLSYPVFLRPNTLSDSYGPELPDDNWSGNEDRDTAREEALEQMRGAVTRRNWA